jgi:hypothetical protein
MTEYDLGSLRNTICKNGIVLADLPSARKRRRLSNDTTSSASVYSFHSFRMLLLT